MTLAGMLAVMAVPAGGRPDNGRQDLFLAVLTPSPAWSDANLESKIISRLTRKGDLRVIQNQTVSESAPRATAVDPNLDSLISSARAAGCRFLLLVNVYSERLESRKSFHLPLVFHKYQSYGVVEGEIRLVDLGRDRLLITDSLAVRQPGPRAFQATMDDDINDPDLHLTAVDKLIFFDKLEDKVAAQVAALVFGRIQGR